MSSPRLYRPLLLRLISSFWRRQIQDTYVVGTCLERAWKQKLIKPANICFGYCLLDSMISWCITVPVSLGCVYHSFSVLEPIKREA